jgi:hypothetical protein
MSNLGTAVTPLEKLTADTVEATTYIGLPAVIPETTTTLVDNANNTFTYTSEDATVTNFDAEHDLSQPVANTIRLTRPDATFQEVTITPAAETVTTLVDNANNTFTYTSEDATVTNFTVAHSLSEPVAGTVRLTRPDATFDEVSITGADTHQKDTVQTTDATLTTIATFTLAADEMFAYEALVAADGPAGKNYWAKVAFGARKDGAGAATLIGALDTTFGVEGSALYTATVAVSGNDVLLQVTGEAAETVDWTSLSLHTGV